MELHLDGKVPAWSLPMKGGVALEVLEKVTEIIDVWKTSENTNTSKGDILVFEFFSSRKDMSKMELHTLMISSKTVDDKLSVFLNHSKPSRQKEVL